MRHSFYFRFYKIIHNDFICALLAQLAYFLFLIKYLLKKAFRNKKTVTLSSNEAHKIIDSYYKPVYIEPIYENSPIDKSLDLSIVVPVYNHKEILEECIMSLVNQKTKYNYEVILVDDGSTDGADKIVKSIAEKFACVIAIFQKNGGIGAARNTGINHARGKYLMFMDCDDTVHEDIIETLMDEAYAKDCDMVMAAHNLVKEKNGQVTGVIPNVYSKFNLCGFKNGDKIMNLAGLPWAKVYKRDLWNDVRFFPGFWYEDNIIHFLIFTKCKKYSYIRKIVYEYRWFEQNFSHTQDDKKAIKVIDGYGILMVILNQYQKIGLPYDDKFYTVLLRHLSAYYYPLMSELDEQLQEALFVVAKEVFDKYKPNHKVKLPYMLGQVVKAFENNDVECWKLASFYQ